MEKKGEEEKKEKSGQGRKKVEETGNGRRPRSVPRLGPGLHSSTTGSEPDYHGCHGAAPAYV